VFPSELSAPLAVALDQRGFASLTAVQTAIVASEARGRDLLVSAQTGSGKTVAFGIAVAPDILGPDDMIAESLVPLCLAIAPTRELALQVAAELTWLYAGTGARIATCVGGMDYRAERRALDRGAQIVVGTPGRLRDHIERGGLDLSWLRAAVLDEADEMLDLGFREDLEFILQRAPETRRTLMFSATLPPAIEKLAAEFQRDGLRVTAIGEARQHVDIAYRALSVAVRDRENAIFNLLRFHDARTAIVFCKTRAAVNHLLARMNNRGFRAVALSGELSQTERMHALQALRDGRSRVCIATDVAARGIDLPGLELVIHADLPTNSETLLHRSGRTGRAGAKGVSALIVTPSDYRKAQRLLQGARVVAEWGRAPSADEVSARDNVRMLDHPALFSPLDEMAPARDLLARFGAEQVAAAFVQLWREGRPPPEDLIEVAGPGEPAAPRAPREFGASVWFELSVGHTGRAEARWLLPKICEAGGITKDAIGAIRVREHQTYVQIAVEHAARFGSESEVEPGLTLRRLDGEPPTVGSAPVSPKRPKVNSGKRKTHIGQAPLAELFTAEPTVAIPPRTEEAMPVAMPSKPRWSKEKKETKARASAATPAEHAPKPPESRPASKKGYGREKNDGESARPHKGKAPASRSGKPGRKAQGKQVSRRSTPRRATGGDTPPRRPPKKT
jgi:ATP-dependent RNA helicase DeaD